MNNVVQLSSLEFCSGAGTKVLVCSDAFFLPCFTTMCVVSWRPQQEKDSGPVTFRASPINHISPPNREFRQNDGFAGRKKKTQLTLGFRYVLGGYQVTPNQYLHVPWPPNAQICSLEVWGPPSALCEHERYCQVKCFVWGKAFGSCLYLRLH